MSHTDRFRVGFSGVSKERWDEIFSPKRSSISGAPDKARIMARIAQKYWPKDSLYCLYQRCGVCDLDKMCRLIWVSYVCKDCDTHE